MPFTSRETTFMDSVIYAPEERKQELTFRQVVRVNQQYLRSARAVGYDIMIGKGSALETRAGSMSDEIPFVGEDGQTVLQPAYDLKVGVQYHNDEIEEWRARSMMGQGASVAIDRYRIENARRILAERENKMGWMGSVDSGIKGLINYAGIQSADVANSGTGTGAAKLNWANKTAQQILVDILDARSAGRFNGVYQPNTLVIPPPAYDRLLQPFSTTSNITNLQWITGQAGMLPNIVQSPELLAANNGLGVDAFMILDNRPNIVELAILRDMELSAFKETWDGWWKAILRTRTAGVILREPKAIVLRKGI